MGILPFIALGRSQIGTEKSAHGAEVTGDPSALVFIWNVHSNPTLALTL